MSTLRTGIANDPLQFGRRMRAARASAVEPATIGNDLRLFAMTFAAGFLFVSIFFG